MKGSPQLRYVSYEFRKEAPCYICKVVGLHKYFDDIKKKPVCVGCSPKSEAVLHPQPVASYV